MKVLQVNSLCQEGSTGKIVYDLHQGLLAHGIDSVVCYGRGSDNADPKTFRICSDTYARINHLIGNIRGIMFGGCFLSTRKLIRIIKREKPDIVHLQCINGYFVNIYQLVEWLKKNKIKTVLTLHAEFIYTGGCEHSVDCKKWMSPQGCKKCPRWKYETGSYFRDGTYAMWKRMKKAFEGFDENLIITSVSPWLKNRAEQSVILKGKNHQVVLNGLDSAVFHRIKSEDLKKQYAPNGEKIVFHATPTFSMDPEHLKGGYYVAKTAEKLADHQIKVLVAGAYEEGVKVPSNVVLLGPVTDQNELARLYSMADVTLLTSKRETFSLVTAESLSCGTPVAGFKAGGPEQIALEEYSRFVEQSDVEHLYQAVLDLLGLDADRDKISRQAIERYDKNIMCENYINVYRQL